MKRILLDENVPLKLAAYAPSTCEVRHVLELGWAHMPDGRLLAAADADGFDVFITADRNIVHQQNLRAMRLALLVLTTNNWPVVRLDASRIFASASTAGAAAIETIVLPHPGRSGGA